MVVSGLQCRARGPMGDWMRHDAIGAFAHERKGIDGRRLFAVAPLLRVQLVQSMSEKRRQAEVLVTQLSKTNLVGRTEQGPPLCVPGGICVTWCKNGSASGVQIMSRPVEGR